MKRNRHEERIQIGKTDMNGGEKTNFCGCEKDVSNLVFGEITPRDLNY